MSLLSDEDWARLEGIVHQDPGRRGLAAYRSAGRSLDAGQLAIAANSLATQARRVGILTGFYLEIDGRLAPETDGPTGALMLAECLGSLGVAVDFLAEPPCLELLQTSAAWLPLTAAGWFDQQTGWADLPDWTHLIAIERVGRSHDEQSWAAQAPDRSAAAAARFQALVPREHQGRCHNMRGELLSDRRCPAWDRWLGELRLRRPGIVTVAIGDGGNELGMGRYDWQTLDEAISGGVGGRIACRTPADQTLIAGVSNWGAWALGLAVLALRGMRHCPWTVPRERALLARLVEAGAVDGVTGRSEPTVDGLPAPVYLAVLNQLRSTLGFAD